ncbi:hypothetical protein [Acidianus sp. RZ1]|uniref:hypothetical protein n=1 Tax=Acidianus sp. RZ1 TaxID=1540082 RepID=UPI00149243A5|nr:hypothetical protein [Acidianus sp. RZ1]NON61741.1 hypothetical protein [Acidianus sp. RZ1]
MSEELTIPTIIHGKWFQICEDYIEISYFVNRENRKLQILHIYVNKMLDLGNSILVWEYKPGEKLMDSSSANRTTYNENPVDDLKKILEHKVKQKGGLLLVIEEKDISRACSKCG